MLQLTVIQCVHMQKNNNIPLTNTGMLFLLNLWAAGWMWQPCVDCAMRALGGRTWSARFMTGNLVLGLVFGSRDVGSQPCNSLTTCRDYSRRTCSFLPDILCTECWCGKGNGFFPDDQLVGLAWRGFSHQLTISWLVEQRWQAALEADVWCEWRPWDAWIAGWAVQDCAAVNFVKVVSLSFD